MTAQTASAGPITKKNRKARTTAPGTLPERLRPAERGRVRPDTAGRSRCRRGMGTAARRPRAAGTARMVRTLDRVPVDASRLLLLRLGGLGGPPDEPEQGRDGDLEDHHHPDEHPTSHCAAWYPLHRAATASPPPRSGRFR